MITELATYIESALPAERNEIARRAKELSLSYTSERNGFCEDYFPDDETVLAYVAAFLLPNAVKVLHCLEQMDALGLIPASDTVDILDIGTGPGTAILAASVFFAMRYPKRKVRFAGIERSKPALIAAHKLFRKTAPSNHSFESATKLIDAKSMGSLLKDRRFNIVTAANVINEFENDEALNICHNVIDYHVAKGGSLIVIDPALRDTTRSLMGIRDSLTNEGIASVVSPCLHQKRCPMLAANERDWCHFYIDWDPPAFLKELDELAVMDHEHLKMAYLMLTKAPPTESRTPRASRTSVEPGTRKYRVVSSPLVSKGKCELILCGDDGELMRVRRLDRDISERNADFDTVMRGDTVNCAPGGRIGKGDEFSVGERW